MPIQLSHASRTSSSRSMWYTVLRLSNDTMRTSSLLIAANELAEVGRAHAQLARRHVVLLLLLRRHCHQRAHTAAPVACFSAPPATPPVDMLITILRKKPCSCSAMISEIAIIGSLAPKSFAVMAMSSSAPPELSSSETARSSYPRSRSKLAASTCNSDSRSRAACLLARRVSLMKASPPAPAACSGASGRSGRSSSSRS